MLLYLGNRDAFNVETRAVDGKVVEVPVAAKGKRRTDVMFPDDWTLAEAFIAVTDKDGIWANHTLSGQDPERETKPPAWVASDSPGLAALLGEHYGCEVREVETE